MKIVYIGYRSGSFETEDKQTKQFESVDLSCVNEGQKPQVITVSKAKFEKFKAAYKVTDEMIIGKEGVCIFESVYPKGSWFISGVR